MNHKDKILLSCRSLSYGFETILQPNDVQWLRNQMWKLFFIAKFLIYFSFTKFYIYAYTRLIPATKKITFSRMPIAILELLLHCFAYRIFTYSSIRLICDSL